MNDLHSIREKEGIKSNLRVLKKDTLLDEAVTLTVNLRKTNDQLETANRVITEKEDLSVLHSNVERLGQRVANLETQMQRIEDNTNSILWILTQQQQNVQNVQNQIQVKSEFGYFGYAQAQAQPDQAQPAQVPAHQAPIGLFVPPQQLYGQNQNINN